MLRLICLFSTHCGRSCIVQNRGLSQKGYQSTRKSETDSRWWLDSWWEDENWVSQSRYTIDEVRSTVEVLKTVFTAEWAEKKRIAFCHLKHNFAYGRVIPIRRQPPGHIRMEIDHSFMVQAGASNLNKQYSISR